jgi:hypothetical protein
LYPAFSVLTLLYLEFAMNAPSAALAKAADGAAWRLSLVGLTTFPSEPALSLFIASNS